MSQSPITAQAEEYRYGFHDPEKYVYRAKKGLNRARVELPGGALPPLHPQTDQVGDASHVRAVDLS